MKSLSQSLLVLCVALGGCAGVSGPEVPEFLSQLGGASTGTPVIPNQVSGGNPGGAPAPGSRAAQLAARGLTAQDLADRRADADALWARANATTDVGDAGDLYADLASDFPEHPQAAEAMYRHGLARYRQGAYTEAIQTLVAYMASVPVNQHLPEVEEMLYTSGLEELSPGSGIASIFRSNEIALNTLDYVAQTFPAGSYADDALLKLAEYYQREEEWALAVLHYKELLIRYPDSEWSFVGLLGLADSYLQRDQGDPYHAGFVDLDPRETYPNERAETFGADVKSSLQMALENYEAFLERIERDPARRGEYATQVAYAQRMRMEIRNAIAAKDLRIARWYRAKGDVQGARTYLRYAAAYSDTANGRAALAELGGTPAAPAVRPQPTLPPAVTGPRTVPTTAPRVAPPVSRPPVVTRPPVVRGVPAPPPPPAWPAGR